MAMNLTPTVSMVSIFLLYFALWFCKNKTIDDSNRYKQMYTCQGLRKHLTRRSTGMKGALSSNQRGTFPGSCISDFYCPLSDGEILECSFIYSSLVNACRHEHGNHFWLKDVIYSFFTHLEKSFFGICLGNHSQNMNFIASVTTNSFILITFRMT